MSVAAPRTRGDCASVPRPCPFVACRYNLVCTSWTRRRVRGVRFTTPGNKWAHLDADLHVVPRDAAGRAQSCALDVADEGENTLGRVAILLGITREAVRLRELRALDKLHSAGALNECA